MKLVKNEILEADYDFSDVESHELDACNWYEYARESRAAIQEAAEIIKQHKEHKGRQHQVKFCSRVQNHIQAHILMSLSMTRGFPRVAWRNLSILDRQTILKMVARLPSVERYVLTGHNPPLTLALNQMGAMTLNQWKQKITAFRQNMSGADQVRVGFFAINMNYDHAVLVEEYTKLLQVFEGTPMIDASPVINKEAPRPIGRKSTRD